MISEIEERIAFKGEHLCEKHQANTMIFESRNCRICLLQQKLINAKAVLEMINLRARSRGDNELCALTFEALKDFPCLP